MVEQKFRDFMDIHQTKLRTSENHQSQWTTLQEIATMLQMNEYNIMKKAYAFELHITANVTSIKSRNGSKLHQIHPHPSIVIQLSSPTHNGI